MTKVIRHDGTDWARVNGFTDVEVERMARDDVDNPTSLADEWADAFVGMPPLKTMVNAKFDVDVVDWFKSHGRGYQTHMNAVLRRYMETHRKSG